MRFNLLCEKFCHDGGISAFRNMMRLASLLFFYERCCIGHRILTAILTHNPKAVTRIDLIGIGIGQGRAIQTVSHRESVFCKRQIQRKSE